MKVIRVKNIQDAKDTEKFAYDALKPRGFLKKSYPVPALKDVLAWKTWANLRRPEQPTFIAKKDNEIVAGIFGEPVETTFDKGESEIQHMFFRPEYEALETTEKLLAKIIAFYEKQKAKQTHFWMLEEDFNKGSYDIWEQSAIDTFGFGFKGFRRISKWTGKPIVKIEKYF